MPNAKVCWCVVRCASVVRSLCAHFHFVVASQIENPKANRKVRVPVRVYQQFQIRLVIKVISVCKHVSYEY